MYANAQRCNAEQLICIDIEAILSQYSGRDLLLTPVIFLKKTGSHKTLFLLRNLERAMGIEPTFFAWEAKVLPLNDARIVWQGYAR